MQTISIYDTLKHVNMRKESIRKRQVIAAVAIIFNDRGRILLTQRHDPKKDWHGKWQFPGGGVEYGEHPIDTLHREIDEEVGLTIELLAQDPIIYSAVLQGFKKHVVLLAFPARYISGKIDISRDPETSNAAWFELHKIDFSFCLPEVEEIVNRVKKYIIK